MTNPVATRYRRARSPFDLKYFTQTVPNEKLTQGKEVLVLVAFVCRALVKCLLVILKLALGAGRALNQHALVSSDRLGSLGLWNVLAPIRKRNGVDSNAEEIRTLRYSSEASCHSLVMVRGR